MGQFGPWPWQRARPGGAEPGGMPPRVSRAPAGGELGARAATLHWASPTSAQCSWLGLRAPSQVLLTCLAAEMLVPSGLSWHGPLPRAFPHSSVRCHPCSPGWAACWALPMVAMDPSPMPGIQWQRRELENHRVWMAGTTWAPHGTWFGLGSRLSSAPPGCSDTCALLCTGDLRGAPSPWPHRPPRLVGIWRVNQWMSAFTSLSLLSINDEFFKLSE